MRWPRYNFWLLLLLILTILAFALLQAEELLPSKVIEAESANLSSVILKTKPAWTLLEKVEEGKKLLKNSPPLEFIEKQKKIIRKQIAFAILNIETGEVFEKRYWLDNKDIDLANTLRSTYQLNPGNLPRLMPVDPNEDFEIKNNWWNGWASDWSVEKIGSTENDIYIVLADKYSLDNSYVIYPEDKTGYKYSDIIFSPPSESIHDAEIVKAGTDYLNSKVGTAFDELRSSGVTSRAFPGKLVVDTISEEFVKTILLVEQTDPDAILNKAKTDTAKRHVAERVLLRYGLNGDRSYRYTVSSAGAVGPAQIMASTGKRVMLNYPTASLIQNINYGRVDMVNAVKSQILVFDDHLSEVISRVDNSGPRAREVFDNLTEDQLNEVRGMIYNGGASKYNIATGTLNMNKKGAMETFGFLEKLRVIRDLKLFN